MLALVYNKYKTTLVYVDIIHCTTLGFPSWCPESTPGHKLLKLGTVIALVCIATEPPA